MTPFSVIVVLHDSAPELAALLPTLERHAPEAQLIVVDNGSHDDGPALAAARGAELIELPDNPGFGAANNAGLARARHDITILLNPDTGVGNVLANFSDPKVAGRETINGVDTVRVTGNVSADAVNKIAPQIGATGPVPGTAWIREDGNHELVQAKLEPAPGTSLSMTCSDWGKPVTVTKPAV